VEFLKNTLTTGPNIPILSLAQWPAASETRTLNPATEECYTKAIGIDGLRAELECREQRVRETEQSRSGDRAALGNIVGASSQMNCVYRTIEKVAA
jgi:DNA-binding NtrC family response regulator